MNETLINSNKLNEKKYLMTPYAPWPYFSEDEIEISSNVLRSGKVNYWTGEEGKLFEKEFAEYLGCKYAIALANGTVALELALYTLDIGPGDEVIVPSRTFIATASAVVARGAKPVVADIDPVSQNITVETIEAVLTKKTKAVIVVHLGGWPCDMDPIMELANRYNLKIIEDCAQAHGARYKNKPVGSLGHIAAFSFCQDKIMTTAGEGGMLVLNDEALWKKAWAYKDHGKDYDLVYNSDHAPGFRWLHKSFGTNWRMTEVQSAIGRLQLRKLDQWVNKRRENAAIFNLRLQSIPGLTLTIPSSDYYHSYYRYYVYVNSNHLKPDWNRDRLLNEITAKGVPCFIGSCAEIYLEEAFQNKELKPIKRFANAKFASESSLAFLVHPTCSSELISQVAELISEVFLSAQI